MADRAGAPAAQDAARGRRAGGAVDESGTMALEVVLVVPVLMLLVLFVLWAGRGGRAGLIADLAAEEAATAAALGCEQGADQACEDLVGDVLSARPGLDFLCIGGARPEGPDGLVEHRWMRFGATAAGVPGPEAAGVGLFGVEFACETDGAVAPLRGFFPTVTFWGRGSEVAIEQGPPEVGISDAEAVEGEGLVFTLSLDSAAVRDVTLYFSISAETGHTSAGTCGSGTADYEQPTPLTVDVYEGDVEATITVPTCPDTVYEADEKILLTLDLARVPALDPNALDGPKVIEFTDHQATGTIVNDDAAPVPTVTATPGQVREGSGSPLKFEVELPPVGRDVTFRWETLDSILSGAAHTDPAVSACPTANANVGDPVDFIAQSDGRSFGPSELTQRFTVSVEVCDDFIGEPNETIYLGWTADGLGDGTAQGTIEDDEPRINIQDTCGRYPEEACDEESAGSVVFTIERVVHPSLVGIGTPPQVEVRYVVLPNDPDAANAHNASPGGPAGTAVTDPCSVPPGQSLAIGAPDSHYDYIPASGTATVVPSDATTAVAVAVEDDALDEHDESFRLRLCHASDNAYIDNPWGRALIIDNDDQPTVTVADAAAAEPATAVDSAELTFTVTLSAVSGRDVYVEYWTEDRDHYDPPTSAPQDVQDLTAAPGEDYTAVPKETPGPGRLRFPAESDTLQQTVTVAVLHDPLDEGDDDEASAETLALRLAPSNAGLADTTGSCAPGLDGNSCALGKITDNDAPPAVIVVGPTAAVDEGDPAVFRLRLVDPDMPDQPMPSGRTVTVDYQVFHKATPGVTQADNLTADAADLSGRLSDNTAEITAGSTEVEVSVGTVPDTIDEADFETFELRLVAGTEQNASLLDTASRARASIADNDDPPHVAVIDACVGSDQQNRPAAHACADEAGTTIEFTVALVDADGNRTDAGGSPHISGRDIAVLYSTVQEPPADSLATGGAPGDPDADYVIIDGTTVTDVERTVRIDAGQSSVTFTVTVLDDDIYEAHETFGVQLASPTNADLGNPLGRGVIVEDDPQPLVVVDNAETTEGTDAKFVLRLIDPADRLKPPGEQAPALSSRAVTVEYHTYGDADTLGAEPGSDYVEVPKSDPPASVVFLPQTSSVPPVSVVTIVDGEAETDERFQLRVKLADGVDASLNNTVAVGTINDLCVDPTDAFPDPPAELAVAETAAVDEGDTLSLEFSVTPIYCEDVTLIVGHRHGSATAADHAHGEEGDSALVLAGALSGGTGRGERSFAAVDDALDEPDETLRLTWGTINSLLSSTRDAYDACPGGVSSCWRWQNGAAVGDALLVGLFPDAETELTIRDRDEQPVVVVSGSVEVVEGDAARYLVRLVDRNDQTGDSIVSGKPVTVRYYTCCGNAGADDYGEVLEGDAVELTFPAAADESVAATEHEITISTTSDTELEGSETFQVRLARPTNADRGAFVTTEIIDCIDGTMSPSSVNPPRLVGDPAVVEVSESAGRVLVGFRVDPARFCNDTKWINQWVSHGTTDDADTPPWNGGGSLGYNEGLFDIERLRTRSQFLEIYDDDLEEENETFTVSAHFCLAGGHLDNCERTGFHADYVRTPTASVLVRIIDDDGDPKVSVSSEVGVEGRTLEFEVSLSEELAQEVTVHYRTEPDGSALSGTGATSISDYEWLNSLLGSGEPLVFTPGGSLTQTVSVGLSVDAIDEPAETFHLRLTSADNAELASEPSATFGVGTIHDRPDCIDPSVDWHPVPTLSIDPPFTFREDSSAVTVGRLDVPFCEFQNGITRTYDYVTADRQDFRLLTDGHSDTASLNAGQTEFRSVIEYFDDDDIEEDETYTLTLNWSDRLCFLYPRYCIADDVYTYTIEDDDCVTDEHRNDPSIDPQRLSLNVPSTVSEGAASYAIGVTVPLRFCRDAEFFAISGSLGTASADDVEVVGPSTSLPIDAGSNRRTHRAHKIDPQDPQTPATGSIVDDNLHEGPETFTVTAQWATDPLTGTGMPDHYRALAPVSATVTILDDDPPPNLAVTDATAAESAGVMTFTVRLQDEDGDLIESGLEARVRYATNALTATEGAQGTDCTQGGVDYIAESGELVFAPSERTKEVSVTVCSDSNDDEPDETFQLKLLTAPAAQNALIVDHIGRGLIEGLPLITISNSGVWSESHLHSGITIRVFSVRVSRTPASTVVVDYDTEDCSPTADGTCAHPATAGNDYQASSGGLSFGPTFPSAHHVTIAIVDDSIDEHSETFFLRLSNLRGPAVLASGPSLSEPVGLGFIGDDAGDRPELRFEETSLSVPEGTTATLTVVHAGASERTAAVNWQTESLTGSRAATAGEDYTAASGTLEFAPGQQSASFTVATLQDTDDDDFERFRVRLSQPEYATVDISSPATVTIEDDDESEPITVTFSQPPSDHDGTAAVRMRWDFSHAPEGLSFENVADRALDVQGASIGLAWRRRPGDNQSWGVWLTPDGNDDITVTIRSTTDCSDQDAVCDAQGRMLLGGEQLVIGAR